MKKLSCALNILGFACILGAIWVLFFGSRSQLWITEIFFLSGIFGALFVLAAAWCVIDRKWRIGSILGVLMFVLYMAMNLWGNYLSMIVGFILVLTVTWGFGEKKWRIGSLVAVVLFSIHMFFHLATEYANVDYNLMYGLSDVFNYFKVDNTLMNSASSVLNLVVVAVPFVLAGIAVKSLPDAWHRRLLRVGLACGYLMLFYYLFALWPPYFGWLG